MQLVDKNVRQVGLLLLSGKFYLKLLGIVWTSPFDAQRQEEQCKVSVAEAECTTISMACDHNVVGTVCYQEKRHSG